MRDRAASVPAPPSRSWIVPAFALVAVLLTLFFLLARIVVFDDHTELDHTVTLRVQTWVTPDRTALMRLVTSLGGSGFAVVVCAGSCSGPRQRRYRTVIGLAGVFLLRNCSKSASRAFLRVRDHDRAPSGRRWRL